MPIYLLEKKKYGKAIILIIKHRTHADGMWTAKQTGNDYGFCRQRKDGTC